MDSGSLPAKVSTFFQNWKARRRNFKILVIGDCGSGKTTLVNNLLGEEIAQDHAPSILSIFHGVFQGVPVTVHETSGLENPDAEGNAGYMNELRALLSGGEVDVIIYCFKATETRMRDSLVRSLQRYHSMGLDWRKTVIALTFADVLPIPKSARQDRSYDQARYFNTRVAEWKQMIAQTLTNQIGVPIRAVEGLKLAPTTGDYEEELPNQEQWFGPTWSIVLDAIKAVTSSSSCRNVMPDQPRPSMRTAMQPPSNRAGAKFSGSNQFPKLLQDEEFGSQDALLAPSSQRENETFCSAECVCMCLKAALVGFVSCVAASCKVCYNVCRNVSHAFCKCDS